MYFNGYPELTENMPSKLETSGMEVKPVQPKTVAVEEIKHE